MLDRTIAFDLALRGAGIPIDGVSGSGPSCRINFQTSATPAQRQQGQQMAAAFDWRPRQPRSLAAIQNDMSALAAGDQGRLQQAILAAFLQGHPTFATDLGINVSGEEPAP